MKMIAVLIELIFDCSALKGKIWATASPDTSLLFPTESSQEGIAASVRLHARMPRLQGLTLAPAASKSQLDLASPSPSRSWYGSSSKTSPNSQWSFHLAVWKPTTWSIIRTLWGSMDLLDLNTSQELGRRDARRAENSG